MAYDRDAMDYHANGRPGKLEVVATKPLLTQRDLSMAYTPGVADPCRAIAENPDDVFRYTAKGNLVAVVTNGTAVLGLGDIGPMAAKPVMEGKANLFKKFADIDVFDIELDCTDPDAVVDAVKAMAPTFGGINLEDIKSPDCFYIEKRLREELDIPVFHDDQHGTAIIAAAALLNALEAKEAAMMAPLDGPERQIVSLQNRLSLHKWPSQHERRTSHERHKHTNWTGLLHFQVAKRRTR